MVASLIVIVNKYSSLETCEVCPQCFDTVVWTSRRASSLYKSNDELLVWLSL